MKPKTKHVVPIEELTDPRLHNVYYLVARHPLHKLVPSGYLGSPGYTEYGAFTREDEGKHVSVTLQAGYNFYDKSWACWINITDADDMIFTYRRPFTWENWTIALDLYNSLYIIDTELLSEFF